MIIAREKRKSNIAEFILYMWQVEDLIRASGFNMENILENIIRRYDQTDEVKEEIKSWYRNLMTLMEEEGIKEKGHMTFLNQLVRSLNDLHLRLLAAADEKKYHQLYQSARDNIRSFIEKSPQTFSSEIEACLTGLYGFLLLRLKKAEVSSDTREAMTSFSNLLAALSTRFREVEEGLRELP